MSMRSWGLGGVFAGLCFLLWWKTPQQSADLAAWVQAIGSIAAVLVAIWITNKADRDRRHAAWTMANLFASNLIAACAELRDTAGRGDTSASRRATDQLSELLEWARRIDVVLLDDKHIEGLFKIRATAVSTLGRAQEMNSNILYDYRKASEFFELQRSKVHEACVQYFWIKS
ncbi:MAG: hypothetical protein E6Q78_05110 [Rhodoferax sp.]|nr:MAG: hypothetical protein E6Q78_05110 [Rhodoferax sp.]